MKELNFILNKTCLIRRLKKDVLKDLPDKQRHVMPIEVKESHERTERMQRLLEIISILKQKSANISTEEFTELDNEKKGLIQSLWNEASISKQEPIKEFLVDFIKEYI